jgi:hypothetical protein
MSKIKAACIHFIISLLLVSVVLTTMFTLWYPDEYFELMGGKRLIYLIACVDIFLGPILTFVVFDSTKKWIKFDLACIAIFQVAAMSYGLYVMLQARPIFTVFVKDAFYVASVVDIVPAELAKGKKQEWKTASLTGPKLVAAEPDKKNKFENMFYETEIQTATIQQYPRFYVDYKSQSENVIKAGKPLIQLAGFNQNNKIKINKFLKKNSSTIENFLYLPIYSATGTMSAVVDKNTGEFIKIIDAQEY